MSALTVLVLASDHHVRTALRHLLHADGLDAYCLSHEAGLKGGVDTDLPVDVALVDLGVTPSTALDVVRSVSGRHPVVVLGYTQDEQAAALAAGARAFVDKTADPDTVTRTLREAADAHRHRPPGQMLWVGLAAFAGPWTVWGTSFAQAQGLIGWHLPRGIALWSMTPALLVALLAMGGVEEVRSLGRRLLRWRVPVWTFGWAVAAPLTIALAAAGLLRLAGHEVELGTVLPVRSAPSFLVFGTFLYLLTEEAAWRGALLPRVRERFGSAQSGLLVGLVWALWHLPLLALPGEHDQGLPVLGFMLLVVATSVLLTSLVEAARGSVLVAALFHASFNAAYSVFGVVGGDGPMFWTTTAVSVLAAGTLALRGRRHDSSAFAAGTRVPTRPLWTATR